MTKTPDIASLMLKMRTLADRIIDAEGENNNGEVGKIIEMYDAADTTFKAQNILLVLNALEAERQQREKADRAVAAERLLRKASDKAFNEQLERAEAAEKERDDLKSAHGNMVTRCSLLRQRTDLPVDRLPAYNALVKAQEEIAVIKAQLANPVVLSDCSFEAVSHMAHWYSEGECVAWVSGAEHVKKQILEAGFTVKEE